ncbi:MAG TPA: collagen-like protein [Ohtaekwangia sp.]|uniref:collagen-like protein n=1 Tax=Ohtaekwangia sp. TaxID=2066019 RepID=UPI002F927829
MEKLFTKMMCLLLAGALVMTACEGPQGDAGPQGDKGDAGDKGDTGDAANEVVLASHSTTSTFLKKLPGFESVETFSLLGSADYFPESPAYVFGGAADGAGLLKTDNGFVMVVNNEDNIAVSRITFDKTFRPLKGEYLLNSDGGQKRLCSATLATPEEHGFGPLFLTCSENNSAQIHGLNPLAAATPSVSNFLPGLGRWYAENAVPLPKTAYTGKTVIVIGDDDSGTDGGQVALYVSGTVGDLENGSVYVMRRVDQNPREVDVTLNNTVDVEFVKIENHKTITGAQTNAAATALKALSLGRVEDIDYRKDGVGRELYFNATGQDNNSDRTKYGRTYKLVLDATDPLKGKLTLILDGDDRAGKAKTFQDPDNIMVTTNYAYITEDPNQYAGIDHDAYLYQYNLKTGELKKVFELNHYRGQADAEAIYGTSNFGGWEYGAMLDVSDILGIPNTFTLNIQVHSWHSPYFKGVDGGSLATSFDEGSQIVVLHGLPR